MERILFDENRVAKLIQRISLALSTPSQGIQADEAEDRQETGQIRSFWELTSGRHSCADGDDDSDLDLVCPSPEGNGICSTYIAFAFKTAPNLLAEAQW